MTARERLSENAPGSGVDTVGSRTTLSADAAADVRHALRTLRRSPAFALLAILVMALGIGANSAVFSVVNAVLLKPLPYDGADRIVKLSSADTVTGEINPLVVLANVRDWSAQSSSFEAMATYVGLELPASATAAAEYTRTAFVDRDFFRVFAVDPAAGRTFTAEENNPDARAVVISHAYWQSRFAGDPAVVGRTMRVGNEAWPIVGVMPAGFAFPGETDLWLPEQMPATSRTRHNRLAVGRLKPGVSLEQARADIATVTARLEREYPESNRQRGAAMVRLQDELVADVRLTLYLLWGVVSIVLLIACANTATLLLGKATARGREIAVRAAVGASRGRIVRQLMTESVVLALIAGGVGMVLAIWGTRALVALSPFDIVRSAGTQLDATVVGFTLAVSLATCVLFGVVPAFHGSRANLADALKLGSLLAIGRRRTFSARGVLIAGEIALAVVLLTAAGLLTKSLLALNGVDLGFQPANVLVMKSTGVRDIRENNAFFTEVMSRVAMLPGVVAVGATSIPPGDLTNAGSGAYFIDRRPAQRDRATEPTAMFSVVAPGTFDALGIPLTRGRDFNGGDLFDRPLVAVVNEALVRRSIADGDPIGRTIFCSFDRPDPMTIVGVVGDVRQRNPALEPMPECYMPYRQHAYNNNTLNVVIRTVNEPLALTAAVRRVAAEVSPDVPVSFTTMDDTVARRVEAPRFRALLLAAFAALAVCLAIAGVYGVMAYAVEQRSREIAVRMALGATRTSVLRRILSEGVVLAAVGVAVGLAGAVAATRLLTTLLFEVQPLDPQVYVGVVALLAAVTLAASYVPGRRASVIDPAAVLKSD